MKRIRDHFVGVAALSFTFFSGQVYGEPEGTASEDVEFSPVYVDMRARDVPERIAHLHATMATAKSRGVSFVYFADGRRENENNPEADNYSAFDGDIYKEIREYAIELHKAGELFDRIVISKSQTGKDRIVIVVSGYEVGEFNKVGAGQGALVEILRNSVPRMIENARKVDEQFYPETGVE